MTSVAELNSAETVELFKHYVIPNYTRYPVNLVRGEGSMVWDSEGQRYLDLFPGWGCNLLGHCPEPVVKAVQEQVATLIHVPNSWHIESQGRWAQMLSERSFELLNFFPYIVFRFPTHRTFQMLNERIKSAGGVIW